MINQITYQTNQSYLLIIILIILIRLYVYERDLMYMNG